MGPVMSSSGSNSGVAGSSGGHPLGHPLEQAAADDSGVSNSPAGNLLKAVPRTSAEAQPHGQAEQMGRAAQGSAALFQASSQASTEAHDKAVMPAEQMTEAAQSAALQVETPGHLMEASSNDMGMTSAQPVTSCSSRETSDFSSSSSFGTSGVTHFSKASEDPEVTSMRTTAASPSPTPLGTACAERTQPDLEAFARAEATPQQLQPPHMHHEIPASVMKAFPRVPMLSLANLQNEQGVMTCPFPDTALPSAGGTENVSPNKKSPHAGVNPKEGLRAKQASPTKKPLIPKLALGTLQAPEQNAGPASALNVSAAQQQPPAGQLPTQLPGDSQQVPTAVYDLSSALAPSGHAILSGPTPSIDPYPSKQHPSTAPAGKQIGYPSRGSLTSRALDPHAGMLASPRPIGMGQVTGANPAAAHSQKPASNVHHQPGP